MESQRSGTCGQRKAVQKGWRCLTYAWKCTHLAAAQLRRGPRVHAGPDEGEGEEGEDEHGKESKGSHDGRKSDEHLDRQLGCVVVGRY